jgi:hypothetical protein
MEKLLVDAVSVVREFGGIGQTRLLGQKIFWFFLHADLLQLFSQLQCCIREKSLSHSCCSSQLETNKRRKKEKKGKKI